MAAGPIVPVANPVSAMARPLFAFGPVFWIFIGQGLGERRFLHVDGVAHMRGEVCDAAARGTDRLQAGRGVPLSQRGLVTMDRARAHAGTVAWAQVRDEGGVFAGGSARKVSARDLRVRAIGREDAVGCFLGNS